MSKSKIVATATGPLDEKAAELLKPFGEIVIAPDPSENSLLPLLGVRVLAHWAGPGFLLLVPLLGREAAMRLDAPSDRAVRRWLRFAIIATPVLWLAVLPQAAWSAWRRAIPSWPPALDPTHEVVSWQDLRQWAGRQGYLGRPDLFVATSNWRDGGKATVALGAELPVLVLGPDPRNFAFSRDVHHMVGRDAVLVAREERLAELIATCRPRFAAIEPLGTLPITRGGQVELRLGLALAHGFVAPR